MIEMECAADVDNNIFMWAVSRDERYKKSPEQLDASLFLFYRQEAVVVMFDDLMYGLSPYVWAGLHHCDGLSTQALPSTPNEFLTHLQSFGTGGSRRVTNLMSYPLALRLGRASPL